MSKKLYEHQDQSIALTMTEKIGQFIFPTGTGKSIIISHSIIRHIGENDGFAIYVIVSPRIILSQQLSLDTQDALRSMGVTRCYHFALHCGGALNLLDKEKLEASDDEELNAIRLNKENALYFDDRFFHAGTSVKAIELSIGRAKAANRPLIIAATYHSVQRLKSLDEVITATYYDEAQYLVSPEFSRCNLSIDGHSDKSFFFTATKKHTHAEDGHGMNNVKRFGRVLASMSPKEAVLKGLILRPRLHFVTTTKTISCNGREERVTADAGAIIDCFKQHAKCVDNISAKLLISARGCEDIDDILAMTNWFSELRRVRKAKNLKVFAITSRIGPCIDGQVQKSRSDWLTALKNHIGEALIIHYDILSEGLDVPGVTGIMPLRNTGLAKFLQTLGRATRLHLDDRIALGQGNLKVDDIGAFVKPYAWIVVPAYGEYGDEIRGNIAAQVENLRAEFGFIPSEDVVISEKHGEFAPVPLKEFTDEAVKKIVSDGMFGYLQELENTEFNEMYRTQNETKSLQALLNEGF